jgi:hypothetical protein
MIGLVGVTSSTAKRIDEAIISQESIPPNMLMTITYMFSSFSRSFRASMIYSWVAPPPKSKKLAGSPPNSRIVSICARAIPAPLAITPMFPVREIYYKSKLLAMRSF